MHRFTKIVATLGPAVEDEDVLRELLLAGVNVVRINGSHGSHDEHRATVERVRRIAADIGWNLGVLFDLQGPKIRVHSAPGGSLSLQPEQIFEVSEPGDEDHEGIVIDCPGLVSDCREGERILIEDGKIAAEILSKSGTRLRCRSLDEGIVFERKGVNFPDSDLTLPSLTEKDVEDAGFAAELGVDMIALSFVRSPKDVRELKALLEEKGRGDIPIVAKIEKPKAVTRIDDILKESWGVMVARGDLGVELPPEDVPGAQKHIIRRAVHLGKPVITATQMLDSMTTNPRPTRAETSDVANAVLDGSDAVMLSGETAMGDYPVEAVRMMDRIVRAAEKLDDAMPEQAPRDLSNTNESVANAASHVSHHIGASAIAVFTRTGTTAQLIARRRTKTLLAAFTPDPKVVRRLSLVWGVRSYEVEPGSTVDQRVRTLDYHLQADKIASPGDQAVICMAAPTAPAGSTNVLIVHEIGDDVATRIPQAVPER